MNKALIEEAYKQLVIDQIKTYISNCITIPQDEAYERYERGMVIIQDAVDRIRNETQRGLIKMYTGVALGGPAHGQVVETVCPRITVCTSLKGVEMYEACKWIDFISGERVYVLYFFPVTMPPDERGSLASKWHAHHPPYNPQPIEPYYPQPSERNVETTTDWAREGF